AGRDQRGNARNVAIRGNCDIGAYDTGAGAPDASMTLLRRSTAKIVADGTSTATITVVARDAAGNRVRAGGAAVTLATTKGVLSGVTDVGDGTYTATLTSSTAKGTATVTGTIGGNAIPGSVGVDFVPGPVSGAATFMSRGSRSIPADGTSTATITIVSRDQFGNEIQVGGALVVLQTTRGSLSSVTDLGNGRYVVTLTSSLTPGNADVTGTINGQTIGFPTAIRFT